MMRLLGTRITTTTSLLSLFVFSSLTHAVSSAGAAVATASLSHNEHHSAQHVTKPHLLSARRLDDGSGSSSSTDDFTYDLSAFSLRYEKCQYVKMFDDDLAAAAGSYSSPLALKSFVVFRLCSTDSCVKCDEPYGRYVTTLSDYLQYSIESEKKNLEKYCEYCDNLCNDNNGNGNDDQSASSSTDCSCVTECTRLNNLQDYGYVDASNYMECQQIKNNYNGGGDDATPLYIGPRCNASGTQITLGFFMDQYCLEPLDTVDVEEVLGYKVSYHLLTQSYNSSAQACISCKENLYQDANGNMNEEDANDAQDADDVSEMCENLYTSAAKCETPTGLTNGFIQSNMNDKSYENQVANEVMACNFIDSLIWNSYTEAGEIDVGSPQDEIIRVVTQNQKISLSFLFGCIVVFLGLMEYFRQKIHSMSPQVQLFDKTSGSTMT